MRILQLCLSDGHGGLELYASWLCELLPQRGYDCRAMVASGTMLAQRLSGLRIPFAEFQVGFRQLPLAAAVMLGRYLERKQIDILHVHCSKDLPLAALAKRLSRRKVRLIYSRHMSITRSRHNPYHSFVYGSLDCLIVLSELMRSEALKYLPLSEQRVEMLYHGVPAPLAEKDEGKPARSVDVPLRVGLFGRIEAQKGQHLLIESVDILRKRGIAVQARIIGHVMDDAYLAGLRDEVSRLRLQSEIEFAPFHPNPQQIMPNYDVVVLTSKREHFGLVLPEAMRCGVAVVGSNAGGVLEIIEHGRSGLLFETGSAISLADQLQHLAENPLERQRLARAGRERADQMFSQERHMQQLEQILARLMKAGA